MKITALWSGFLSIISSSPSRLTVKMNKIPNMRSLKIISCKIMNVTPKIIQKLIRIMKSNAEKTRDGWIPDKNIIFGLLLHHENYR